MKLQINNAGHWLQVMAFADCDMQKVLDNTDRLGRVAFTVASLVSWRVVDEPGNTVAVWTPTGGWRACEPALRTGTGR